MTSLLQEDLNFDLISSLYLKECPFEQSHIQAAQNITLVNLVLITVDL